MSFVGASFLHSFRSRPLRLIIGAIALAVAAGLAKAQAGETVLYSFKGGSDGCQPFADLIFNNGALYGTTTHGGASNLGTVFKLAPPLAPARQWTETVLYGGGYPRAGLIFDADGALYGTTGGEGTPSNRFGTVFKLTPPVPPATRWGGTVLHRFQGGSDGRTPVGGLVFDADGALYGTTWDLGIGYGTVFKLTPPTVGMTRWIETKLHVFTGGSDGMMPSGRLLISGNGALYNNGALYGTTQSGGVKFYGYGTVFKLTAPSPPARLWSKTFVYAFEGVQRGDGTAPVGGLISDRSGALYGTTHNGGLRDRASGYGTVFKLSPPVPPSVQWTETVLYRFQGGSDGADPAGALIFDSRGALYGTTAVGGIAGSTGYGTVFKLTPPVPPATEWTETVLYRFQGLSDGANPTASLIFDTKRALYGTTTSGGIDGIGCGTVFRIN